MTGRYRFRLKVAAGALLVGVPSAAFAQADTPQADASDSASGEIVVTALKREQRVQDIPASISAVSGEALSQRGIANIRDLSTLVPNLVYGQFAGATLITIRGIGSNVDSGVTEPTVAQYIDGVALPRASMSGLRPIDLERVEVLRGPQGTLYGRNATGGAINYISPKPTRTLSGKIEGSVGSRDAWGVDGFLSGPLANGVYVRISGGREKQDGYVEVVNTGKHIAGVDAKYGRIALLLEPSSDLSVDLSLRYDRDDAAVAYQQQLAPNPFFPGGLSTDEPNKIFADQPFTSRRQTLSAQGTINWSATDNITIRSITGYIDHKSDDGYDADSSTVPFYVTPNFHRPSKSISQEFTVLGDFGRTNFIVGAYYFNEKYSWYDEAIFQEVGAAVNFGIPVGSKFTLGTTSRIRNYAAYGEVTHSFTDSLKVNLGLRINHEANRFTQSSSFLAFGLPETVIATKVNSTKVLPKIALLYDFNSDIHGYAQWTKGYKSGGSNPGSPGTVVPAYKPENLDAYEVGLKSQFLDRRLTANIAAFYYKYKDLQVYNFIPPTTSLVENANARIYGVEADFRLAATDHLTLSFSPSWLHGTFKGFGGFDPFTGNFVNLDGKPIPRAPKFSATGGIEQRFDLGGTLFSQLAVSADVNYSSKSVVRYFDTFVYDHQNAYALVNLSMSITDVDRKTRLSAFVNNVTDKLIRQSSYSQAPSFVGSYGPPRTWGVRLSRAF